MRGYEDKVALSQAWKEKLADVWTWRAAKMVSSEPKDRTQDRFG